MRPLRWYFLGVVVGLLASCVDGREFIDITEPQWTELCGDTSADSTYVCGRETTEIIIVIELPRR